MDDERWEQLSAEQRVARLEDALFTLTASGEVGRTNRVLVPHSAYLYPTSLGEWLGHAVELAGDAMWQAPFIPLLLPDAHEHGYPPVHAHREMVRTQGAQSLVHFGAALWSALMAAAPGGWDDDEEIVATQQLILDKASQFLDEVRDEHDGFPRAVSDLGAAVFILGVHLERGGNPDHEAIVARLVNALGWLTAAVASTDVLAFAGLEGDADQPGENDD